METYDPHKNTTEVRQASRRTMSFRVLIISVLVLVVIFAVLWAIYSFVPQGGATP